MNTKLKMAIVGAGIWGGNHAAIYKAHPFAEVVAICDMQRDKAQAVADKMGIPDVYDDFEKMFRECGCDAVAVVTPDFAHADIAISAAKHKKHILIEKPLATTREDVFAIMEAVEQNGVRAMVDLHNRWNPPFYAAWKSARDGELGELQSAYMRLTDVKWVATDMLPWAAKSSILWFLGSHSLDTLRWMFDDEVVRVYSVCREGVLKKLGVDTIDQYLTTLEFKNGGIAHMENGWVTPDGNPCWNDMKFTLLGDKGMISMDVSNHNLVQKITDNTVKVPDILVQNYVYDRPAGFAFESIRSFVDCIISGEDFHLTLRDAANTSLALLAVMESAKTRTPVEVKY